MFCISLHSFPSRLSCLCWMLRWVVSSSPKCSLSRPSASSTSLGGSRVNPRASTHWRGMSGCLANTTPNTLVDPCRSRSHIFFTPGSVLLTTHRDDHRENDSRQGGEFSRLAEQSPFTAHAGGTRRRLTRNLGRGVSCTPHELPASCVLCF